MRYDYLNMNYEREMDMPPTYIIEQLIIEEQQYYEFHNKTHNMADAKEYKKKLIRVYKNDKKTPGDKLPTFQVYLDLPEGLPPGTYKSGVWENDYQGKISYDTTKIEPHEVKPKNDQGYNQRQSDQQYKNNNPAPDLPF